MTALSVTTIALSITDGCPGLAFYILEIIVNTSMIVEVTIRFIAFGRVSRIQPAYRVSLGLTCLTARNTAILEISVQHNGPHHYGDMRGNHSRDLLRRMWFYEQRRRVTRHVAACRSECSSVCATGVCDATVSFQRRRLIGSGPV